MQRFALAISFLAGVAGTSFAAGEPDGGGHDAASRASDLRLNPEAAHEYRAELLHDVLQRASLAADPATIEHSNGRFAFVSADKNNRLQIGGEFQYRYWGVLDAQASDGSDDYVGGFQSARTRLDFSGTVLDPNLGFRLLVNANRSTGAVEVQDAYGEYKFAEHWRVRWGQFKLPFTREFYSTNPTQSLTIEASITDIVFRMDRSQAVMAMFEGDRFRFFGAFSDGRRNLSTDIADAAEADAALTGRIETRFGEAGWKQHRDLTSFRGDAFGVLLGAAGHWQQEGSTGAPSSAMGTRDLYSYTFDVGVEGGGWNALAAVSGRLIEADGVSLHDLGLVVQGGVFINENVEIYGRYAHIFPDGDRATNDSFNAMTAGLNWYVFPKSHAVKLTGEVTFYPGAVADSASVISAPSSAIGLMPDADDGQVGVGFQLQIVY